MRLAQLEYLLAIRKSGSITKAAQQLYIAQPTISLAMKELEEELGYPLLETSKRGTKLTVLGEQVIVHAEAIMQHLSDIQNLKIAQEETVFGRVFVSAVPFVCESFMLQLLIELKEAYPELFVFLDENDAGTILRLINNREIDFGIVLICNNEERGFRKAFQRSNLVFEELYTDKMCFLVGEKNPLYARETASMQELLQFPYIYYKNSYSVEDSDMFHAGTDVKHVEAIQMVDRESVKKYVAHSQAVTAVPYESTKQNLYLKNGILRPVQIADLQWTCRIGILYRKDIPLNKAQTFLLNQIRNMFAAE